MAAKHRFDGTDPLIAHTDDCNDDNIYITVTEQGHFSLAPRQQLDLGNIYQ